MATKKLEIFTCDQCGKVVELKKSVRAPMNWATLKHSDRYEETIETYHMCGQKCYTKWLKKNERKKQVNNDTWSLYIESGEGASSVWPRYPLLSDLETDEEST